MNLTEDEVTLAVDRLRRSSKITKDKASDEDMRMLVTELARAVNLDRSEEAVRVFMLWMGNDS